MTGTRPFLFLFVALLPMFAWSDETFPQPDELQPDVDFWISIFTRYASDDGVLHDNRNLGVVYDQPTMPADLSRRARQRTVAKALKSLRAAVR